jgi:predicted helicase
MRYTVYDKSVAVHLRRRLSDHFFNHQNFGLVLGEAGQEISGEDWDAVCCVDSILQLNYFRRNGSPTLPLYLYDEGLLEDNTVGRRANLSSAHLRQFADSLKLEIGKDGLPAGVRPEDIFHYAYAVFHSPGYRRRYAQFLMTEFPRLPLTRHLEMFHSLVRFGSELVGLHLLKSIKPSYASARFVGSRNPEIEKVSWLSNAVWIDKAQTVGFVGVNEAVWKFHIGGYRVCEKWLNDRRGRSLTKDDITHYQKIIFALTQTIRLMGQVDEVIEAHGGWPRAFQSIGVADTATLGIEATTQAQ